MIDEDCANPADRWGRAAAAPGFDRLCRKVDDGPVRERAGMDGPRTWPPLLGLVVVEVVMAAELDGRRRVEVALGKEGRDLGMAGVAKGLEAGADDLSEIGGSEMGGDGGVGVSDNPDDDAVFAGGVSNVGDEALVVVGDSSERGEAEVAMGWRVSFVFSDLRKASRALLSFSLVISASIFRSDNSSLSLCASMRRLSRSCSPVRTSSSSKTLRSSV